jgi:hypothetical protein
VAEDIDGEGAADPLTLVWNPVDVTGCAALSFEGTFAARLGKVDAADFIKVSVSLDGVDEMLLWWSADRSTGDGTNENFALCNTDGTGCDGRADTTKLTLAATKFERAISGTNMAGTSGTCTGLNGEVAQLCVDTDGFQNGAGFDCAGYVSQNWCNPSTGRGCLAKSSRSALHTTSPRPTGASPLPPRPPLRA